MRRGLILVLVLLLAAAGLWLGCTRLTPPSTEEATSMAALGLVLLDSEEGVSVLAVKNDSPAEYAGIRPGDLLLQADGHPFSTILQLEALLPPKQSALQLQLMRRQQDVMTVLLRLR